MRVIMRLVLASILLMPVLGFAQDQPEAPWQGDPAPQAASFASVPDGTFIPSADKALPGVLLIEVNGGATGPTSVRTALEYAGYAYDIYVGATWTGLNLARYDHVFVCFDGGVPATADIQAIANYASNGGNLHMFGGVWDAGVVGNISTYLIGLNTSYYPWSIGIAGECLTFTDTFSYLARPLPKPFSLSNANSFVFNFYVTDPAAHVVATTTFGAPGLVTKRIGAGWFDMCGFVMAESRVYNSTDRATLNSITTAMLAGPASLPQALVIGNAQPTTVAALASLGATYETSAASWSSLDLKSYRTVFACSDGGNMTAAEVQALGDAASAGTTVNLLGGTALTTFTDAVNTYLLNVDTANYNWKISNTTPNMSVVLPAHRLAYGLPGTVNFADASCNYHQLVPTGVGTQVAVQNNQAHPALVTRYKGRGKANLLTHSPYYFGSSAGDAAWFRQVIANMLDSGAPVISAITDVAHDQGGQVRLSWKGSFQDKAGGSDPVATYTVWRRVATGGAKALPAGGTWDLVTTVPASGLASYQAVVPTLADSSISGGMKRTSFCVSAAMADGKTFWYSMPDSGYSKDNLAPSVPTGFARINVATLGWGDPVDDDFRHFTVYGSNNGTFDGTATVVGHSIDRTIDVNHLGWKWYYLTATDFAGNESAPASLNGVTAVPGAMPVVFALHGAAPNPFNPRTEVRFDLPRAARVTLAVYDVAGRLVRTLVADEEMAAGQQVRMWDGTDEAGRAASAGTYLCRMRAGEFTEVRSMTLLK